MLKLTRSSIQAPVFSALLAVTAISTTAIAQNVSVKKTMHGKASYYAHRFHGRLTANGERFNMHAMTAAHKTLKFGTRVRVTNKANGKSVVVRINDRGPYIKGRHIDMSYGAAKKLGMMKTGTAKVKMEILKSS